MTESKPEVYILQSEAAKELLLPQNAWILTQIADYFSCKLVNRGNLIKFIGTPENMQNMQLAMKELQPYLTVENLAHPGHLRHLLELIGEGKEKHLQEWHVDTVIVTRSGKTIRPKTRGQKEYVDAIRSHTITFGIGPAGTGKTYLAVALAVFYFRNRNVKKIILTRPAVEAGENLGYLPGDLNEKVDPYLRPLYDALGDLFGADVFLQLQAKGIIEVAPLAYMRGRTLEDCFVILDEAQNTTPEQMKMFLTRLGNNSKMVINGDTTQIDLPKKANSGLKEAVEIVGHLHGIATVEFSAADVVRNDLVAKIIHAYAEAEEG